MLDFKSAGVALCSTLIGGSGNRLLSGDLTSLKHLGPDPRIGRKPCRHRFSRLSLQALAVYMADPITICFVWLQKNRPGCHHQRSPVQATWVGRIHGVFDNHCAPEVPGLCDVLPPLPADGVRNEWRKVWQGAGLVSQLPAGAAPAFWIRLGSRMFGPVVRRSVAPTADAGGTPIPSPGPGLPVGSVSPPSRCPLKPPEPFPKAPPPFFPLRSRVRRSLPLCHHAPSARVG